RGAADVRPAQGHERRPVLPVEDGAEADRRVRAGPDGGPEEGPVGPGRGGADGAGDLRHLLQSEQ
ncbi:hypothetical protein THAOC_30255, partial [Thalassiosira oceanica]